MEGKIVVTVIGKDKTGIVAGVSQKLSELKANIIDITQTIFEEKIFAMIMLIDSDNVEGSFNDFRDELKKLEEALNVKIYVQHEDIFKAMHKI
jgi:ACT domain-containing protein